jgi:hypothetical protein
MSLPIRQEITKHTDQIKAWLTRCVPPRAVCLGCGKAEPEARGYKRCAYCPTAAYCSRCVCVWRGGGGGGSAAPRVPLWKERVARGL